MDYKVVLALSLPFGLAITAFGSALALGKAVASAMDATARQPEASGKILLNMIAGCALIEALTIYALALALLFSSKI